MGTPIYGETITNIEFKYKQRYSDTELSGSKIIPITIIGEDRPEISLQLNPNPATVGLSKSIIVTATTNADIIEAVPRDTTKVSVSGKQITVTGMATGEHYIDVTAKYNDSEISHKEVLTVNVTN